MTDPRPLATVVDYDGLLEALRARASELDISRETIDAVSGLQSGYSAKLLASVPQKRLGMTSLGPLLQTLGLALVVVVDDAAAARLAGRLTTRERKQGVGKHDVIEIKISRRKLGILARRGGKNRTLKLTARKRSAIARKASKARWRRARLDQARARARERAAGKRAREKLVPSAIPPATPSTSANCAPCANSSRKPNG